MELLLRRHIWIVDLLGILIGSALAGHATATLIGGALAPYATPPPSRRALAAAAAPVARADKSIENIVDRNMFCSSCDGVPIAEPTRRPLRLLAIMFAPPPMDPRWSVAIVRNDAAATAGPYGVGARLGGATIVAIEEVRVVLDADGRPELLELLQRRPGVPADARRARAEATFEGVTKIGVHSYEVRRAVLDRFLAGGVTPPWPRVVPQAQDGDPVGFRLFGIGNDGPFAALGLANGDTLLKVNGRSLATPDAALAAVTALRTATHLSLLIERDGRFVQMEYVIR